MHEMSIAENVVEVTTTEMKAMGITGVDEVTLEVGLLSGVSAEALSICYEAAARGTALEGSKLSIEEIPVAVICGACGRESQVGGDFVMKCGFCGKFCSGIVRGKELNVKSVKVK